MANDDTDRERPVSEGSAIGRWLSKKSRAKRPSGSRDFSKDWTWLGQDAKSEPRGLRPFVALAIMGAGVSLVIAGGVFLIFRGGGTSSPRTGAIQPSLMAAALSPPPSNSPIRLQLAVWQLPPNAGWRFGELRIDATHADAAPPIPFLLRVDNATIGDVYGLDIRYSCRAGDTAGYEFLTHLGEEATNAPLMSPGPRRAFPDASVPVPDDPSISADDGQRGRSFELWGGTPDATPLGPGPVRCLGEKTISMRVRARAETMYVLWAGQVGAGSISVGAEMKIGMGVLMSQVQKDAAKVTVVVQG